MKLLFDHNLSHKLPAALNDLFECAHVRDIGLHREASDREISDFARAGGYTIVTADADFLRIASQKRKPLKVIRLERMDYSTRIAAALLRRHAIAITEFCASSRSTLIIRNS